MVLFFFENLNTSDYPMFIVYFAERNYKHLLPQALICICSLSLQPARPNLKNLSRGSNMVVSLKIVLNFSRFKPALN